MTGFGTNRTCTPPLDTHVFKRGTETRRSRPALLSRAAFAAVTTPQLLWKQKTANLNEARATLLDQYRKFVPQDIMNAMDWGYRDPAFFEIQTQQSCLIMAIVNPEDGSKTDIARHADTDNEEYDGLINRNLPYFTIDDFNLFLAAEREYKRLSFGFFSD